MGRRILNFMEKWNFGMRIERLTLTWGLSGERVMDSNETLGIVSWHQIMKHITRGSSEWAF